MALTLAQLQDYINTNVKKNGRQAITGDVMNYLMLQFVDWVDTYSALPDKGGHALKFLRVNAAGTALEWAAVSSGITVGTTPVTSGTDGRVFFQSGGVVSQSANFTFDGTLGLIIGNNTNGFVKTSTQSISGVSVGEITNYSLNNFPLVKLTGSDLNTYFGGRIGLYHGNTEKAFLRASSTGGEIKNFNLLYLKQIGSSSGDNIIQVRNSLDNGNSLLFTGDQCLHIVGINNVNSYGIRHYSSSLRTVFGVLNNGTFSLHNPSLANPFDVFSITPDNFGGVSVSAPNILYLSGGSGPIYFITDINMYGKNMQLDTTTGTKIGTSTSQKLGFWNSTPISQQILATGASHSVDDVISLLQTLGLCRQS